MLLFPFDQFTLSTKLPDSEVLERLGKIVEKTGDTNFSFWGNYTKPYRGQINDTSFTISRNISYRNSFKPLILGQISATGQETKIAIEMRMHILVIVIVTAFLLITGFLSVAMTVSQIQSGIFAFELNIPLMMFAIFYLAVLIGFHTEKVKSKKFLQKFFEA